MKNQLYELLPLMRTMIHKRRSASSYVGLFQNALSARAPNVRLQANGSRRSYRTHWHALRSGSNHPSSRLRETDQPSSSPPTSPTSTGGALLSRRAGPSTIEVIVCIMMDYHRSSTLPSSAAAGKQSLPHSLFQLTRATGRIELHSCPVVVGSNFHRAIRSIGPNLAHLLFSLSDTALQLPVTVAQ